MRSAGIGVLQIVAAGAAIAAGGGIIGLLISTLATSHGAVAGLGWGMISTGALFGLMAGGSGSPSENLARARFYGSQYWGSSVPLPQSPLQLALGGVLAFGAGLALLILTY
jgi:hypothetical protein